MRFVRRTPLLLLVLSALLAGCGGNQIAADEVPVEPPVLTIPTDAEAAPGAAAATEDDTSSGDEDADADATPTPTADAGTSGAGTTGGTTGGTAPAATPTPAATTAPNNTGGAQADEGLDQFCADNPGAC
jgi:hypothetical protein